MPVMATDYQETAATESSCTSGRDLLEDGRDGSKPVDIDIVWALKIGKSVKPPKAWTVAVAVVGDRRAVVRI